MHGDIFLTDTSDSATVLKNNVKTLEDFGSVLHPEELVRNEPQKLRTQTSYKTRAWPLILQMRQSQGVSQAGPCQNVYVIYFRSRCGANVGKVHSTIGYSVSDNLMQNAQKNTSENKCFDLLL